MSKFLLKIYFLTIFFVFMIFSIIFVWFNIYDLKNTERENFENILSTIELIHINNKNIPVEEIANKFYVKIVVYDNQKKCVFGEENTNKFLNRFIENSNINKRNRMSIEQMDYNNIYYIKKYEDNLLVIYKNSDFLWVAIRDFIITYFIFIAISLFVYYIVKKYIKINIIIPLREISNQIPKLKDKNDYIFFDEYDIDEINQICIQIKKLDTNFKNMGNKLKIEQSKINYILDNMNEGFILFDKNKNVCIINKMARKIFNCDKEIYGENILYYTQNIKIIENVEKVLKTKQKKTFDIEMEDGKIYSVHINKIQKGVFQNYSGVIMLIIDVTSERQNEKMKQEFFSNVSHEIKTPITSIQGYTELLYNDFAKSREQEKEFLRIIQKETTNITNLINNILTISKLENKELEINRSDLNIKTVVEDIINSTKPICIERNIKVINKCEDITILADYKKIHQLLNNLIVNAIKYNKDGGYVEILCLKDDKNIKITVKDSGIGIPLVDRNRIFERFYRVQKGRSKADGGTGLGLSIVKHIVQYYNGKIKVKSTEGFGSEFIISIPIK